jgi:hypothetical protein
MKLLQEDMFTPTISKVKNKTSVKPQRTLCLCVKNTFFQHRDTEGTEKTTENVF